MKKFLLVAFDGLDKELIEEFDLSHIKQFEFGYLENKENIKETYTSELFASFISGKNHEHHGVVGINGYLRPKRGKLLELLTPKNFSGVRGFYTWRNVLEDVLKPGKRKYDYQMWDDKVDTLFEKIDNSRAVFVPSYNPSAYWAAGADLGVFLQAGYSGEDTLELYDELEYPRRKLKLFSELENEILPPREFLMCHFHRPDTYQHVYGDSELEKDKLKEMYNEMDELAAEIKEKALEKGYDYVIFMSDHGLPAEDGHNENAFYSCNKELFGDETPHITDFHDKILELTGNEDKIESK